MDKQCKYTKEDVWDYYSNAMTRDEEAEIQEHIASCSICKKRLAEIRGLSDTFGDVDEEDEPVIHVVASRKANLWKYVLIGVSIAAIIALFFILKPSGGYPTDVDPGNSWGSGDSSAQDSSGVEEMKLDTIYLE